MEEEKDRTPPQLALRQWHTPVLAVFEIVEETETFNGGAGDADTGS